MNGEGLKKRPLSVPKVERRHFARNFISQAVCELRFPTLFELESDRPPADFVRAVRKEFPTYQPVTDVKFSKDEIGQNRAHAFKSRKERWTVNLKAASFSLETSHYDSFEEFESRLGLVLSAATRVIDTEFFTRIGLRYINVIPCGVREVGDWINQALVAPLASGFFGDPDEYRQRVVGATEGGGGFLFNHGLGMDAKTGRPQYFLDYDFFVEDVPVDQALATVRKLHDAEHDLFRWSLGAKARQHLGL